MAKQLKKWNGRGHGKDYDKGHFYVAAYSKKQAVELMSEVSNKYITTNEVTNYYSNCWGNSMDGIEPTEPCVYYTTYSSKDKPLKLI